MMDFSIVYGWISAADLVSAVLALGVIVMTPVVAAWGTYQLLRLFGGVPVAVDSGAVEASPYQELSDALNRGDDSRDFNFVYDAFGDEERDQKAMDLFNSWDEQKKQDYREFERHKDNFG